MRVCQHLIKGTEKQCALGVSPVNCSFCSMFQLKSRRQSQQPSAIVADSEVANYSADDSQTVSHTVSQTSSSEQHILRASAVKGGCGCRKG